MPPSNPLLRAALRYARVFNWRVFPLRGKVPYEKRGFHTATIDEQQIRAWWERWPDANIGLACDSTAGPIIVDIDGPSGARLIRSMGDAIPATRRATSSTQRKSHLYFNPPANGKVVGRTIKLKMDGKPTALDILGDGGYVVAPPSVHPDTGRLYRWTEKRTMVPFPDTLLRLLDAHHGTSIERRKKQSAAPLPDIIGEGERDQLLTSLAGSMRRRGTSEAGILAALREENSTRVVPPLPDSQIRKIAKSISLKSPAILDEHCTDLGNARRFVVQHSAEVRAVMANKRPFMLWDAQRWTPDTTGHVERLAKQTVRRIYSEASRAGDDEQRDQLLKHAHRSESAGSVRAMLELAKTEPELSTTARELDANPWFFNVSNGTINLKTGELLEHDPDNLITRLATVEYDRNASAPRWQEFLLQIMDHDRELVEFLQRAVGYALTGDIREQCLFFCYGQGSNGKSTFLETLRHLFGDYGQQSDFNSFLSSKSEGPRNDLARMQGARMVTASEADGEKGFDTKIVKLLTGDDTIVARRLYEEHFEFKPQHKLFLAANHKPIVKEITPAFWRRMRLIPFTVSFTDRQRDKRLTAKLQKELPGILNWAMEGCAKWRASGLTEPRAVTRATTDYREENDILGEFIGAACHTDEYQWVSTTELYKVFTEWWESTRGARSQPISMGWFGRLLGDRPELKATKKRRIRGWQGVGVRIQTGEQ